jgi:methylthioribose-1-phosphate isomerase
MARRESAPSEFDPSRRAFFRTFSRQTVRNAGAVVGAAAELRRTSLEAARGLMDPDAVPVPAPTKSRVVSPPEIRTTAQETFRSAYRFTGESVVVLDQRELPARVLTFECHEPSELASAMRSGAITPGPVLGQVAAYGVALAAASVADRAEESREQVIRAAAGTLRSSRGDVHSIPLALDRMIERYDSLANVGASGGEIRDGLISEADTIATDATQASARIGQLTAALFETRWRGAADRLRASGPIHILVHGDGGPLACGTVGMTTAAIQTLTESPGVHVWVTEAAPSMEGTRVTALQLTQLDVPHTVIPDSAVSWLFSSREVSAALLRGDTLAANGEAVALMGSLSVAVQAREAGVDVLVLAPEAALNRDLADATGLRLDLRSAAELGSANAARLNPVFDIVPPRLVSAYVSENGVSISPARGEDPG